MTAPFKDYFYQRPWWKEIEDWTPATLPGSDSEPKPWWVDPSKPQTLPDSAPWSKPVIDGYPSWVDPPTLRTLPSPAPEPWNLPPLLRPQGPGSSSDPSEGAPKNWLLSYHDRNGDDRRRPINSAPAGIGPATGEAPAESAGGLLGILYEMMRQSEPPKPDAGFDSNPQDTSQRAPPERRLGRRTYRL